MTADHYLPVDVYRALIEALAATKADPASGELEPHCFVEALGEIGGIWPASVLDDPELRASARHWTPAVRTI